MLCSRLSFLLTLKELWHVVRENGTVSPEFGVSGKEVKGQHADVLDVGPLCVHRSHRLALCFCIGHKTRTRFTFQDNLGLPQVFHFPTPWCVVFSFI